MRIPRPQRGARWLLTQTATYESLGAAFALMVGSLAALNYWGQGRRGAALVAGLGTAGVFATAVARYAIGLAAARRRESTHELEGCLYTLHAVLAPGEDCRLRLAIHVPVGEELEQVTEYVGDKPKAGRIGRRFPANAGIIGKAYRENDVFVARRRNDDYEAYVHELITDWNYTEERARFLHPGVNTWMALPIFDAERDRVEGVLYLDSTCREFFTAERQELVLAALSGIAVFIGKRYT